MRERERREVELVLILEVRLTSDQGRDERERESKTGSNSGTSWVRGGKSDRLLIAAARAREHRRSVRRYQDEQGMK